MRSDKSFLEWSMKCNNFYDFVEWDVLEKWSRKRRVSSSNLRPVVTSGFGHPPQWWSKINSAGQSCGEACHIISNVTVHQMHICFPSTYADTCMSQYLQGKVSHHRSESIKTKHITTIAITHNKTIVSILLSNSDLSKLQSYRVRLTLKEGQLVMKIISCWKEKNIRIIYATVYKILMFKHQCWQMQNSVKRVAAEVARDCGKWPHPFLKIYVNKKSLLNNS